jgi:hypothetical protein
MSTSSISSIEYYNHSDHTDTNNDDDEDQLDLDLEIPDWAICPLTLEIMNDPLMDRDGLSYERKAIVEWLNRGHATCPLTRKPLSYRMLAPNAQLKFRIDRWRRQHNQPVIALQKGYEEQEASPFSILLLGSSLGMNIQDTGAVALFFEQRAAAERASRHQERREQPQPGRSSRRRTRSRTTHGTRTNGTNSGNNDPAASISPPRSKRRSILSILDSALSAVTSNRN